MKTKIEKRYLLHKTVECKFSLWERVLLLLGFHPIVYLTIQTDALDVKEIDSNKTVILGRPNWLEKFLKGPRKLDRRKARIIKGNA